VAGLLTRFLPSIEAFFVANASATRNTDKTSKINEKDSGSNHEKLLYAIAEGGGTFLLA
jgi:hypothetical protein